MERLTKYMGGLQDACPVSHNNRMVCMGDITNCLATYENTGLMPEDIAEMQNLIELQHSETERLQAENATLKKALELACDDAADGCCPNEATDYVCHNAQTCPNANGNREDSGIDKKCWYEYYIQQAKEQEGKK